MTYDQLFRIVGDEEGGVSLHCRVCDTGSRPVGYLCPEGVPDPYARDAEVGTAYGIASLLRVGERHARGVHGQWVKV